MGERPYELEWSIGTISFARTRQSLVLMLFLTIDTIFVKKKRFFQLVLKLVVVLWFGRHLVGWQKGSICFVDGRMNSNRYGEVLKNHLVDIDGSDWIFQEDNAAVHRSKVNITWFKWQKINVLSWLSLSPDLKPIENVWRLLAREVYTVGMQFRTRKLQYENHGRK